MKPRIAIAALSLSAAAFAGILTREGFSPQAYPDPTRGESLPTLGFGSTSGVRMGDTITPVAAINRSLREVTEFEGAIKRCVTVPLYQAEYDAYLSLAHNIGPGAFCGSTVVKRLNAEDYRGACEAILLFKYSNGHDCSRPGNRICPGLWADRQRVYQQCMSAQQ
jgi:lysozyme